jgi:hypothetical protein
MASIGSVLNNKLFIMNSLHWVHLENIQRRSLGTPRGVRSNNKQQNTYMDERTIQPICRSG